MIPSKMLAITAGILFDLSSNPFSAYYWDDPIYNDDRSKRITCVKPHRKLRRRR